jgi:hypothetical protein
MRLFIGAGILAIFIAIAVGICTFFGIINGDAYIHPQQAYKRVKLIIVKDPPPPPAQQIPIHYESGCASSGPLKIIWSIRHQAERWRSDDYHMTTGDTQIWIGNDDWGLEINKKAIASETCRKLLWTTITKWQTNKIDAESDALTQ